MSEAKSDVTNEDGTVGTSDGLPVRAADGPLVTTSHSSPLPVSPNRFYREPGGECSICGGQYPSVQDAVEHELEAHGR